MVKKVSPSTRTWTAVPNETLSGGIVAQIRAAVLNKEIVAGQFLGSEAALSEQFGVSRMAARDALRTLEGLGIVEIRMGSRGGVWVAQGNPDRLADAMAIHLKLIGVTSGEVFDAQMAIEEMAAELAAERRNDADLERLRAVLAELSALKDELDRFADASMRFHEAIVQASHSRILLAQFRALSIVLRPVLRPNLTPASAVRIMRHHKRMLAAIESGDGAEASRLMRERLSYQRNKTLSQEASSASRAKD
ncbi:FadR/GntR family transcriptional regulator [Pigmentiphaga sp.]|uniref:FadR/GntR family transcriptional regulator n=1 Tax=Pigmentiphaga sp. TaxID=1977564 RepID=UPI0025F6F1AB|nr:FCD domain-containing protein [Pigmentiphaga sp.]MBX6319905.1 FadR family transcriptional regulator [Pigmentiphaga sp.]